jgi:hypothetical protein
MGLTISHGCFEGPYSTFNDFRYALAEQIGISLDDYAGYRGAGVKDLSAISHDIMPLLNHSDCDGELSVEESKRVAAGLLSIMVNMKGEPPNIISRYIHEFREGLLHAIERNEVVEFR